jgi:hypothetical protein
MNARRRAARCFPVAFLSGWFLVSPVWADKPVVVSTYPANGAVDVPPDFQLSITFDRPMDVRYGGALSTSGWMAGTRQWSSDGRTLIVQRGGDLPVPGATVRIILNPSVSGLEPAQFWFRDAQGNFLDSFTFSFTVSEGDLLIPANPGAGFHWPYLLYVPNTLKTPVRLLVEPNNTLWSEDLNYHIERAKENLRNNIIRLADPLGAPYLMPVFPRYVHIEPHIYTHALDRNTLTTTLPGLERIDLQLLAMIDDARARLQGQGINVEQKFWLRGFSASGSFVSRFTTIHPERVQAVVAGAGGYGPIVPVAYWAGETLPYPTGVSDLAELVGRPFNAAAFRQVPIFIYVGDRDANIVPWYLPDQDPEVALIDRLFGGPDSFYRYPLYEQVYRSVGARGEFRIAPGFDHRPDWASERDFLEYHRATQKDPRPKPLQYEIWFPHVACMPPWKTEVGLASTVGGVAVRGELEARDAAGTPLESVPLEIPAWGHVELILNDIFAEPEKVAYVLYHSDSAFVAGHTRFYESNNGNRISIRAGTGETRGWLTKNDREGWTGIAFVNVAPEAASVRLEAVAGDGVVVDTTVRTLEPGEKEVGLAHELFTPGNVARAAYFRFSSDRKIIGFTISGSWDGRMMDGIIPSDRYMWP